jgi:transcriptional regulator with XRE-family HTH domain
MVYRQAHQPGREIPCARHPGDPLRPVREHERCFRAEWNGVLRAIAEACPTAADECSVLLKLDPLRPDSDAAITDAVASIRHLSDPCTIRTMRRERERSAFGQRIAALRREKGWSLRRLARECTEAARRLGFGARAPDRFQLMDYERGRSNAHARARLCWLLPSVWLWVNSKRRPARNSRLGFSPDPYKVVTCFPQIALESTFRHIVEYGESSEKSVVAHNETRSHSRDRWSGHDLERVFFRARI